MSRFQIASACFPAVMLTFCTSAALAFVQPTVYVDDSAPPGGNGTTWNLAYRFLQDALVFAAVPANGVTEIRIGQGTQKPDRSNAMPSGSGNRNASFQLINGVAVRGGYAGFGAANPNLRDVMLFPTILDGDLLGNDGPSYMNMTDNSFHIVTGSGVNSTAHLSGFTVRRGNSSPLDGAVEPRGAGMLNIAGNPSVDSCIFTLNFTTRTNGRGAGMANINTSAAAIDNCTFVANHAKYGGGMYNDNSSPTVTECIFSANLAGTIESDDGSGAGMYNRNSSPFIDNCTFTANRFSSNFGSFGGGGVYNENSGTVFDTCVFELNADTTSNGQAGAGGAIYNNASNAVIVFGCTFTGNRSTSGGAILNSSSNASIRNCVFTNNSGGGGGGAINNGGGIPVIADCTFDSNHIEQGGAISNIGGSAKIVRCIFKNNTADHFNGGAISNRFSATPYIVNCSFFNNRAVYNSIAGGAIYSDVASPTIVNCMFSGNKVTNGGSTRGGGLYHATSGTSTIVNCTFNANDLDSQGGGSEQGAGIYVNAGATAQIRNCIIHNNTPDQINGTGTISVNYSNVQGGFGGIGNINIDPRFVDPNGADNTFGTLDDNLHIYYGSPCIDAGNNSSLPPDTGDLDNDGNTTETIPLDLDGLLRLVDDPSVTNTGVGSPPVDMGPYEVRIPANTKLWMPGTGVFGTAGNWIPTGAPTAIDTAVLHRPSPGEAVVFNAPAVSNKLEIGAGIWSFLMSGFTYTINSTAPDALTIGSVPALFSEMRIYGPGPIIVPNALVKHGILCGYGTLQSNVVNIGLVAPGGGGAYGQLTFTGTYTQLGTLNGSPVAGYLECDIGGNSPAVTYDQVVVSGVGTAILGGGLQVHLIGGYQPPVGSSFTVLTAGSITGSFNLAFMPAINDGGTPRFMHPVYQYGLNDGGEGGIAGGGAVMVVVDPLPTALDFGNPNSVNVPGAATAAAVGDFDGVNGVDLAITINGSPITNPGSLIILLNNGSGIFTVQPAQPQVGVQPRSIAVGQLNGDSNLDIAVANFGGNSVTVRFNSGGANFSGAPTTISEVGTQPASIAAARLDGNTSIDLVVANSGSNDARVLVNNGAGAYSNGPLVPGGNVPIAVDPSDVDNDRDIDLIIANNGSRNVTMYSNNGSGTFAPAGTVALGGDPVAMIVSNVNNDAGELPEIITTNYNSGTVSVLINQGGFNFSPAVTISAGTKPRSLVSVNLDGDGDLDLAVVTDDDSSQPVVRVFRNDLNGGSQLVFTASEDLFTGSNTKFVLTGEADANPGADLIAVDTDTGSLNDGGANDAGGGGIAGATNSVSLLPNLTVAVCIGDIAPVGPPQGNGTVNVDDLLAIVNGWGACPPPCPPHSGCRADIAPEGGNCVVNVDDLLAVITGWGPCS